MWSGDKLSDLIKVWLPRWKMNKISVETHCAHLLRGAYFNASLTTTRATIVAQGFFVITLQPLQLDRCSNPLRMWKVFLVLLKKTFFIGVRGSPGVGSQSWGVFVFLTNFDGPWTPIPWTKILAQTVFGNYTISRVDRALAWPSSMSGTKVMAQKPHFTPKIRKLQKMHESPTGVYCSSR